MSKADQQIDEQADVNAASSVAGVAQLRHQSLTVQHPHLLAPAACHMRCQILQAHAFQPVNQHTGSMQASAHRQHAWPAATAAAVSQSCQPATYI